MTSRFAQLQLYSPPEARTAERSRSPNWLFELRRLRSDVLFAQGVRPAFGPGGAHFGDPDSRDAEAFHVVARSGEAIVGCVRLLPLSSGVSGVLDDLLGAGMLDRALRVLNGSRDSCIEASRLVVHPDHQRTDLARRLIAACWVVGDRLGASMVVAGMGTRDHQDRLMAMGGARSLPALEPVGSATYADVVRPMYAHLQAPARLIADYVAELSSTVRLAAGDEGGRPAPPTR